MLFSIIIVDDNLFDRENIKDLINWEKLGINVVGLASNGEEGYKKAVELKPDFILTDVAMPIMDGLKMAEMIKRELPDTRFIFMSCFEDFSYIKEAMELDAYRYVLKPIELEELTEALKNIRDIKQRELERGREWDELKQHLRESLPVLRVQFFRDLLQGELRSHKQISEHLEYLDLHIENKLYTVIYIHIDNFNTAYSKASAEQRHLLVHGIKRDAQVMIAEKFNGYIIDQQSKNLALVLFSECPDQEDALSGVLETLNNFKDTINKKYSVEITIGIGEFSRSLSDIGSVFESAEHAVKAKFYSQGNRIILSSQVISRDSGLQYDLQMIKNQLTYILEKGEKEDVLWFVEVYYKDGVILTESYIKSLTFSIVNIAQTILLERNESIKEIFGDDTTIWDKLLHFETIVDIKQWILNILDAFRQHLSEDGNKRYRKIVEDIKSIIDVNYAVIDTIDDAIKPLYISRSGACSIFKSLMGMTIYEYILYRKMEAAKELLADPYIKIYEVAEKVGYKSKSYFSSVFKEYTGITPKQYSDKHSS